MGRSLVSLDLGSSGVRAVETKSGKKGPTVMKIAFYPLSRNVIVGGQVADPVLLTEALKDLWAKEKFTTKEVAFAVANDEVLVRQTAVEWLPTDDFRKALPYQIADDIDLDIKTNTIDFHVLSEFDEAIEGSKSTKRMVRLLLVAASCEMLDGFVDVIKAAGLTPVRADITPFALIRALKPAAAEEGVAEAIIEIGGDVTNIIIHQGGQPRFVRIVANQGGNAVTDALCDKFGWSAEDAERSKIQMGLSTKLNAPGPEESVFGGFSKPQTSVSQDHPAQVIIDNVVGQFIREINTSLDFFLSSSDDIVTLSKITLVGGGTAMNGFASRLSSELQLPVEWGSPLSTITLSDKAKMPPEVTEQQLTVAVGLSVGVVK